MKKKTAKPAAPIRGRPTKYTPEKCDIVIAAGKKGHAVAEMAVACDVCIDTIYEWAKVHQNFSEALTRAQVEAEAFWARRVREGLGKAPSEFQGPANLKYMGIRFQDRWSERARVELSGPGGGPVQTEEVSAHDVISRRIAGLAARKRARVGAGDADGDAGE